MHNVADFIKETSATVGTGAITLSGAVDASVGRFRDAWQVQTTVYYAILDGLNRESGQGTFDGSTTLIRNTIYSKIENGIYDDTNPTPIDLHGQAIVACTLNADTMQTLLDESGTLADQVNTNTLNIETNRVDILANENNISTNANNISTNANNIATNTTNITANTGFISTNQTNIATNTADIATNTGDISSNTGQISLNTADIAINAGQIAANTGQIDNNINNIAANNVLIQTNITDITAVDRNVSYRESAVTAMENIDGPVVSNGPTSVLVPAGLGEIVDSYTDPEDMDTKEVSWIEQTFELVSNGGMPALDGLGITDIGISRVTSGDGPGTVTAYPNGMSPGQRKTSILLATVEYSDRVITGVGFRPIVSNQVGNIMFDYIDFGDGVGRINGLVLRPTNLGGLSTWRDVGEVFIPGANYEVAKNDQNVLQILADGAVDVGIQFTPFLFNSGDTIAGIITDQVTSTEFEPDGAGTLDTVANGATTIHYMLMSLTSKKLYFSYGQQEYSDYNTAKSNLFTDKSTHKFASETSGFVLLAQIVIEKNASTWGLTAEIFPIGSAVSSGSEGGSSTSALNVSYTDVYNLGNNVQSALDSLAQIKLSPDQYAAINAATAPSVSNPYATESVIGDKADKVIPAVTNNIAVLDATGNPADGGKLLSDLVDSVVAGTNISVDNSDPANPVISAADSINEVVEDLTPQLGGALDSNGKTFNQSSYRQAADVTTGVIDYSLGDMVKLTATADKLLNYAGFVSGLVSAMIFDAVNFGDYTISYPGGTLFAGGTSPAYTSGGTDRLLLTKDAADVYTLSVIALDIK